ncbi:glycoside hydrolase family 76 protein [Ramaria rubella]|nr:glycoside hydrolase family 76 protein [Ramaria rubella]
MFICIPWILALIVAFELQSACAASQALTRRQQCAATLSIAEVNIYSLQANFWDGSSYINGITWTDANAYEDLNNLMLASGVATWDYVNSNSTLAQLGIANAGDWDAFFQGSFDDAQWVILSYYKMADFLASKVWWSGAHDYKNAVTNELYILTSANGYLRTRNQTYLDNAQKAWNWLLNSGMRNSQGLFNDGLDMVTCQNNGQTTWTYNQGIIASALGNLGVALKNTSFFDQAEITLDAAVSLLTVNNGILKESCDNATSSQNQCDHDQGVFTKHLQYYLDAVNDEARTAKYSDFLGAQQSAVFHFGKAANNLVGSVWYAPNAGGSIFTAETTASGMAATVADAKYGPC